MKYTKRRLNDSSAQWLAGGNLKHHCAPLRRLDGKPGQCATADAVGDLPGSVTFDVRSFDHSRPLLVVVDFLTASSVKS
jgi:hypothetical protein